MSASNKPVIMGWPSDKFCLFNVQKARIITELCENNLDGWKRLKKCN